MKKSSFGFLYFVIFELKVKYTASNFTKMLYNIYEHMFGGGNMKIVAKPIEVVSWTDTKGNINPEDLKLLKKMKIILLLK